MTYTLRDFELKPGDWVRTLGGGWKEFIRMGTTTNYPYHFSTGIHSAGLIVEAVLRPSIIIREKLDDILVCVRDCAEFKVNPNPELLTFEIVEPRKPKEEPKKSLFDTAKHMEEWPRIQLLCDRLEALEKKLGELK